jgi:hypothetical protein
MNNFDIAVILICTVVVGVVILGAPNIIPSRAAVPELNDNTNWNITVTLTPIPTPVLTDLEKVNASVTGYFLTPRCYGGYQFHICDPVPTEPPSLHTLAMENAMKGEHCLKIVEYTPEDAIKTFTLHEMGNVSYSSGLDYDQLIFQSHHTYGMAVYKTQAPWKVPQYNICIVFQTSQPDTTEKTANGAYHLVHHPDVISYLWE